MSTELYVFAYGTLRSGESNHRYMESARFVERLSTAAEFTMVSFGSYPAIVEGGQTAVVGEVYQVDLMTLARLDLLEEVPELYRRVTRRLGGRETMLYVLPAHHARGMPVLTHGDWCQRKRD